MFQAQTVASCRSDRLGTRVRPKSFAPPRDGARTFARPRRRSLMPGFMPDSDFQSLQARRRRAQPARQATALFSRFEAMRFLPNLGQRRKEPVVHVARLEGTVVRTGVACIRWRSRAPCAVSAGKAPVRFRRARQRPLFSPARPAREPPTRRSPPRPPFARRYKDPDGNATRGSARGARAR